MEYLPYNIVRDWEKSQGVTHPTDLSTQIIRDYNIRYITVENSSPFPIGVAITSYLTGPVPNILFTLGSGEIKHLGINTQGGPTQYLWILDLESKKVVNEPSCLERISNSFVLRHGMNKWFVQNFSRPSYASSK